MEMSSVASKAPSDPPATAIQSAVLARGLAVGVCPDGGRVLVASAMCALGTCLYALLCRAGIALGSRILLRRIQVSCVDICCHR